MHTPQIRRVLTGIATLVTLAAVAPAHAAPPLQLAVQILDPSGVCASWTSGGTILAPTLTCVASAPPVAGAPVGCLGTATPSPVAATGGTLTLGVTGCDVTPTLGVWQTGLSGATISGPTMTVPSYTGTSNRAVVATVQACSPTTPTACAQVTAQTTQLAPAAPPPVGGGAGGAISCAGFNKTIVVDLKYQLNTQDVQYSSQQSFGNGDIVVARFTTPSSFGVNANGNGGSISVIETLDRAVHTVALSTTACDFTQNVLKKTVNYAPEIMFFSGTPTALQPSTTYYLNVTNAQLNGTGSCSSADCAIAVTLITTK